MGSAGTKGKVRVPGNDSAPPPPGRRLAVTVGQASSAEFDRLAAGIEAQRDSLAASLLARVREKHPGLDWGSTEGEITRLTRASLRAQLRSFRTGTLPERCPDADSALAGLAPRVGLPVLLDGYRRSQATLWQAWFELVEG